MKQQKRKIPKGDFGKKYVKRPSHDDFSFVYKRVIPGLVEDGLCSTCGHPYLDHPNEVCNYHF